MHLAMQDYEAKLFRSFMRCSTKYLEFGCGGSTCLAASLVSGSVITIDSSSEWLEKVSDHCRNTGSKVQPSMIYIDIGPTGDWGYPVDPATRDSWPNYHQRVWDDDRSSEADMYLVDGRFRVACFMQILLHSKCNPVIAIHDFSSREFYHVISEVAREIARADDLSVFQRKQDQDRDRISAILAAHLFSPE